MIFDEETSDMLDRRLADQLEKARLRRLRKAQERVARKQARDYGKANRHSARQFVRRVDSDDQPE